MTILLWSLLAFFLYAGILSFIGFYAHKNSANETVDDLLLGNRSLNYFVTALSAHASDMSSWIFLAFPMQIYLFGPKYFIVALGLLGGMFCNWHFLAKKIRIQSEKYNTSTLTGLLLSFYPKYPKSLNIIATFSMVIFTTYYLAAGLTSIGLLFDSIFGINYYVGVILAVVLTLSYTIFGGYASVAWTDFFQAIFLLCMIIFVPIFTISKNDLDFYSLFQDLPSMEVQEDQWVLGLSWGLGYFGLPHVLSKFMGIGNSQEIKKSKWLGMSWQLAVLLGSAMVGLVAIKMFSKDLGLEETLFIHLVKSSMHPFFASFILCAVLAATISTMDSQILVLSSSISEDLRPLLFASKKWSNKSILNFARIGGISSTFVAMFIAFLKSQSINETVFYAWSGLGLSFGPVMIAGLFLSKFNKKKNSLAAIMMMLTGILTTFIWPLFNITSIPTMIVGFIACFVVYFTIILID